MARSSERIEYGCEMQDYNSRTIARWLANLKADRKAGAHYKYKGKVIIYLLAPAVF